MEFKKALRLLHDNGLILERAVLIGSSVQEGTINDTLSSIIEDYPEAIRKQFGIPEQIIREGVQEVGDWLIDNGKLGWLGEFFASSSGTFGEVRFFYGYSIELCVNKAIAWKHHKDTHRDHPVVDDAMESAS